VREDIHTTGIPVLCVSCEARHRGICGALNPDQLVALSKSTKRHRAETGKELMSDCGSVDRFSNVLSGVVKLTKTLSDGRQQIVAAHYLVPVANQKEQQVEHLWPDRDELGAAGQLAPFGVQAIVLKQETQIHAPLGREAKEN